MTDPIDLLDEASWLWWKGEDDRPLDPKEEWALDGERTVGDLRRLLALARDAEGLRKAATAYIDWRERRAGQWEALANCGHDIAVSAAVCPEWRAVHDEPFDIDERLDDALRAALEGTDR